MESCSGAGSDGRIESAVECFDSLFESSLKEMGVAIDGYRACGWMDLAFLFKKESITRIQEQACANL